MTLACHRFSRCRPTGSSTGGRCESELANLLWRVRAAVKDDLGSGISGRGSGDLGSGILGRGILALGYLVRPSQSVTIKAVVGSSLNLPQSASDSPTSRKSSYDPSPHCHLRFVLPDLRPLNAAKFTLEKDDQGVTVQCDGKLFTRYLKKSGTKPVLWPVVGPTGKEMTRGYPLRDLGEFEKKDHIHHRSFWFDHGDVNGTSFWHEEGDYGIIEHCEYMKLEEGEQAVIQTRNDWKTQDGTVVCQDVRTMTFGGDEKVRWIDFQVKVMATHGKAVFGDTKEGSFGLRVAGSMRAEREGGGTIINSNGETDGETWGKQASWVDYSGPVGDDTVGIAILNHPRSLRYPTYWHVRVYGLFAANPFGLHDFLKSPEADGSLTLEQGDSFELFYRVILHAGDANDAEIDKWFDLYKKQPVGQ